MLTDGFAPLRIAAIAWQDANQRHLMDAVRWAAERLRLHAAGHRSDLAPFPSSPTGSALERLTEIFALSPFERSVLLLCAGMELDGEFPALCAHARRDSTQPYPTFGLALAILPDAHWSALTPDAPLRYWRLIEVGGGASLVSSPLRIDERVLHFLTGVQHLDEHLAGYVAPERSGDELLPTQAALADAIARALSQQAMSGVEFPVVQLVGDDESARRTVAAAVCERLGFALFGMSAAVLPTAPHEMDALVRLWQREAALSSAALLLDCDEIDAMDAARAVAVALFVERTGGLIFLSTPERRRLKRRVLVSYEVNKPDAAEQQALWEQSLGSAAPLLNGHLQRIITHFNLNAAAIRSVCAHVGSALTDAYTPQDMRGLGVALWNSCREQARLRLDDLAQRVHVLADWDDLVLPPAQIAALREIALQVRQRTTVYGRWGFAERSDRGLGVSALFVGASGVGKTMAAEVLANELELDLYKIDLSQVVSKYIGETEKNLRRVFDAAEEGGAILLFDEADALFGKRSEVKDSHDRYANIEVSYLLQRMEAHRGLAILTTNMKNALDPAFLRRIRFVVHFPFPDATQRAAIWRRIFPPQTPTQNLEPEKLAQLTVAGGHIRNIALAAAFLAAEEESPVTMRHLLQAARSEYAKIEKTLTAEEVRGWM
ncbi:MAG: ATP-binding protein [Caldilinea sp.]|nr:ATP-binding protein [Caldilinea sp.]MDW8441881.1 ATP-binding protein [Caldilineaceae bacterium]